MDLIAETAKLRDDLDRLPQPRGVIATYNPLRYAWEPHRAYLKLFSDPIYDEDPVMVGSKVQPRRIVLVGMNPGPWGMCQTGVPFGDVPSAKEIIGPGIHANCGDFVVGTISNATRLRVTQPAQVLERRPVQGFACERVEESGKRLWSILRTCVRRGVDDEDAEQVHLRQVLEQVFAVNWCPLAFFGEAPPERKPGWPTLPKNLTPSDLDAADLERLRAVCSPYLRAVIRAMRPEIVIASGRLAEHEVKLALASSPPVSGADPPVVYLTHPSPRNGGATGWNQDALRALAPYFRSAP